jgi:hypothetical protein
MVEIALDVGYTNPSHFAQLFRKEPDSLPAIIVSNADKSPATLLSNLWCRLPVPTAPNCLWPVLEALLNGVSGGAFGRKP